MTLDQNMGQMLMFFRRIRTVKVNIPIRSHRTTHDWHVTGPLNSVPSDLRAALSSVSHSDPIISVLPNNTPSSLLSIPNHPDMPTSRTSQPGSFTIPALTPEPVISLHQNDDSELESGDSDAELLFPERNPSSRNSPAIISVHNGSSHIHTFGSDLGLIFFSSNR